MVMDDRDTKERAPIGAKLWNGSVEAWGAPRDVEGL